MECNEDECGDNEIEAVLVVDNLFFGRMLKVRMSEYLYSYQDLPIFS